MPVLSSLLVLFAIGAPDPAPAMAVSVVRFYRADVAQTQVAAFIEASPLPGSSLSVRVSDAAGATLWDQQWPRSAPGDGAATVVERLRFTVGPGTYHLEVAVRDSTGAVVQARTVAFDGFMAPPGASDLLLATQVRSADAPDAMPRAQEFRRGDLLITAAARAVVGQESPSLHYFLEAYNGVGGPGTLSVVIETPDGLVVREAQAAAIRVPVRVAMLTGQLDLATLPAGEYRLRVQLVVDGRLLEREAGFEKR